ncbi:KTSC domain-containing protein [Paraclostridium bifermentans]|uniref:KTSC domain-containing protein n=1 Tax=Paraclostridium bifermentans TaxID=1490 RepID=UPI002149F2D1|nr:KTSC domain-containing protein [Paraclostridium bifermentans]MCR1874486.1 KTSC domain-containing protein [Paraclostridium bifermentans]
MKMINISTGNIVSIGYDESRKVFRVKLKNSTYEYNRVPKNILRDFLNDLNKTKFYNSRIRHFYSVHKVR